jgi:hypothetical protein
MLVSLSGHSLWPGRITAPAVTGDSAHCYTVVVLCVCAPAQCGGECARQIPVTTCGMRLLTSFNTPQPPRCPANPTGPIWITLDVSVGTTLRLGPPPKEPHHT